VLYFGKGDERGPKFLNFTYLMVYRICILHVKLVFEKGMQAKFKVILRE